tara:strand:+ start:23713 stop:23919 length:207 start_codon:yes stop_codon:yes gene_type:complete
LLVLSLSKGKGQAGVFYPSDNRGGKCIEMLPEDMDAKNIFYFFIHDLKINHNFETQSTLYESRTGIYQ